MDGMEKEKKKTAQKHLDAEIGTWSIWCIWSMNMGCDLSDVWLKGFDLSHVMEWGSDISDISDPTDVWTGDLIYLICLICPMNCFPRTKKNWMARPYWTQPRRIVPAGWRLSAAGPSSRAPTPPPRCPTSASFLPLRLPPILPRPFSSFTVRWEYSICTRQQLGKSYSGYDGLRLSVMSTLSIGSQRLLHSS